MERNFIHIIVFLLSTSGFHLYADIIIYGEDQREEIEDSNHSHLSEYLVAMVDLQDSRPLQSFGQRKKLCKDESFYSQPSISKCSGLLIKGKYILTAAHCISHSTSLKQSQIDCSKKGWLMDYQTNAGSAQGQSYRMLNCKRVIEINKKSDYALIEVKQEQRQRSFSPRLSKKVLSGDSSYYALGFPSGLPMKSVIGSYLGMHQNQYDGLFNFDTFQGSSGSPIFNESGELVGVLKTGRSDFVYNQDRGCFNVNKCDDSGVQCTPSSESFADKIKGEGALLLSRLSPKTQLRKLLSIR